MAEHNNRFSTLGKDGVRQHICSSRDGLFSIVFTRPTTESWRSRLLGNRPVFDTAVASALKSDVALSTMLEMGGIQGWLEDALTKLGSYGRLRLLLSSSPDDVLSTFNGWGFV